MKILLFGDWRENAGPANVNKSLIQHADADMLYIKSAAGIRRTLEVFYKLLVSDVVVFSAYGGLKFFKIAKRLGKKVAILKHGDLKFEGEINHQFVPANQIADDRMRQDEADAIICASEKYSEWVAEHYPQYKDKLTWVNNGVDIEPRPKRNKNKNVIAIGGGNRAIKNNINVCKAIEKLNAQGANITVESFGAVYPQNPSLDTQFPFVKVMGQMDREAYLEELDKVSLYVDAAYCESFGISPIEALICNCSLLISTHVGALSVFKETNMELVKDCDDVEEIAQKISKLLDKGNASELLNAVDYEKSSGDYAYKRLKWICRGLKDGKILK